MLMEKKRVKLKHQQWGKQAFTLLEQEKEGREKEKRKGEYLFLCLQLSYLITNLATDNRIYLPINISGNRDLEDLNAVNKGDFPLWCKNVSSWGGSVTSIG